MSRQRSQPHSTQHPTNTTLSQPNAGPADRSIHLRLVSNGQVTDVALSPGAWFRLCVLGHSAR